MPSFEADRNLLLGILALQMDFVGRDDLIAAMNAWVLDKAKPLGQVLNERGALSAERVSLLEALVREHLKQHGDDPQRSLAAVRTTPAVADVLRRISGVTPPRHDPGATTPEAGASLDGRRYRILRPHARGGLGEVFVAHDEELRREVALKEMRPEQADDAAQRARFVREAEVTGRLEHPGVVPVYGLGAHGDGRPYYAMRFIRGDSLKDAIAEFHKADNGGRSPGERAVALRQLLARFLDVCNAVAYAHSRGVLHRDLKPANVMVGRYGETLVVDWGLAKVVGHADAENTEGVLVPDGGDADLTRAGAALGTPSYMSPEQADGQLDRVGPRSDVYSLGATLYCLLTGSPPFAGGGVAEVLDAVRRNDFPRPRERDARVAPPLEAVCLKAMALNPEDRYATPRALADDLERWLADEAVEAYPEAWPARLGRWRRRHRTLVAAVGVVALTLLGAAVIGAVAVRREQGRTRAVAQADALADASADTVPALLASLREHPADVMPRLTRQWEEEQADGRRLRVGLALAADVAVRARLIELARKADDPQEVLLVRHALAPHSAEVIPLLWGQVKAAAKAPAERFRLLALLAGLDPVGDDWPEYAGATVADLLAADLLHLGTWKAAFEPVRGALLPALAKAFRGDDLDRRRLAAALAADYAADRPETLADLLLDANERQFAALFPGVQAHRERAVALLVRELRRELAPDWNDAAPSAGRAAPEAGLVRRLEAAGGLAAGDFALCQTMPLSEFLEVAEALRPAGYRPVRFRPYAVGAAVHVAAVWARDGRDWRLFAPAPAGRVLQESRSLAKEGFVPVDVAGVTTPDGAENYVALWEARQGEGERGDMYLGVADGDHTAVTIPSLQKQGLSPVAYHRMYGADGRARNSAVWRKPGTPTPTSFWAKRRPVYEAFVHLGASQLDVGIVARAGPPAADKPKPPETEYTGVWQHVPRFDSRESHGLDPRRHRDLARSWAAEGYRPVAIAAAQVAGQAPETASVWRRPIVTEDDRDALAGRQANAAVALLRLGEVARVEPLLKHGPDPRLRSYLVHRLAPFGVGAEELLLLRERQQVPSARRALLLALGECDEASLPPARRKELVPSLMEGFRRDPDAGSHSAYDWLLRRWGEGARVESAERELAREKPLHDGRGWYVNGQGQTLSVVRGPVAFDMGSPRHEPDREPDEVLHWRRVGRSFAVGTKEVTVEQFERFKRAVRTEHYFTISGSFAPEPDCPIISVTWYEAAMYCRWLSQEERIDPAQMCYPELDKIKPGMTLPPDYLKRTGYRLPTEAEWEYACRAGAATAFCYGNDLALLKHYAWHAGNSEVRTWPVGRLKPNDLGLFDMHGNAFEWCHDEGADYPPGRKGQPAEDREQANRTVDNGAWRILRGGAFIYPAGGLRSADRTSDQATQRNFSLGFRVARTQP